MHSIPGWKNIVLIVWLAAATSLTLPVFLWQLDYFRRPGPEYRAAFLIFVAVLVLAALLYSRSRRRFAPWLLSGIPILLGILHDPRAVATVLLMTASSFALGGGICDLLAIEADLGLRVTLGLGSVMTLLSWIGLAGLFYWPVILAVLVLPLAIFRRPWKDLTISGPGGSIPLWSALAAVFGLVFLICSLCPALAPSLALDVIRVELPSAQFYAAHHRIEPVALIPYSWFPQGVETLVAAAFSLGGRTAAQIAPVLFLGLAALICRALARHIGTDKSGAWMAALCAAAMPFVHWTGSVGKNDVALASFELCSLYCLARWAENRSVKWIFLAAAFLGFACSVKYTVLYGAVPLSLLLLYACWRHGWPAFWRAGAIVAILGFVWPARAWLLTGNPVYPEHLGRSASIQLAKASLPWTEKWIAFLETPWTVQFHPVFATPLHAPVGILFALFLPVWFLRRSKWRAGASYCVFFAILYWLYWAAIWPVLRFGVAPLMTLALLTVVCLFSCYGAAPAWLRAAINLALVYSLLVSLSGVLIMEINAPQLRFLARRMNSAEYLRAVLPSYPSMAFLKGKAGPGDLVLSVGNCSISYAPFPWNCECIAGKTAPAEIRAEILARPFRFLILPSNAAPPLPLPAPVYRDEAFSVYALSGTH